MNARALLSTAADALIDERRQLEPDELAALAALPAESVPALAALAHEVRLAWCGPEVEVEGILSAKTGGCPEDCHFCSQSAQFESPVKATPFLDPDEVLRRGRGDGAPGCVGVLHRARRARPRRARSMQSAARARARWCASAPASTWPSARASSRVTRP